MFCKKNQTGNNLFNEFHCPFITVMKPQVKITLIRLAGTHGGAGRRGGPGPGTHLPVGGLPGTPGPEPPSSVPPSPA